MVTWIPCQSFWRSAKPMRNGCEAAAGDPTVMIAPVVVTEFSEGTRFPGWPPVEPATPGAGLPVASRRQTDRRKGNARCPHKYAT
jgi:hypothetical protein